MSQYNTGNASPSSDMRDAWDNNATLDDFTNTAKLTVTTRTGIEYDSLAGMQKKSDDLQKQISAKGASVIEETRQSLIPLGRQYMSLNEAQADIANIPNGSSTYVRSQDDSALAFEYINNNGNLEPTGKRMGAKWLDITSTTPAATWIHNCVILGNSTYDHVTVINNTSVTGVSVLISATPGETVYIGNPVDAGTFRILDLVSYPIDGMTRPGSRYSYDGTGSDPDDATITFDGIDYLVKKYIAEDSARYILIYQSATNDERPLIFSTSAESGYRYLSTHAEYNIENNLTLTDATYERIADEVRQDFGAAKLYGGRKTGQALPYLGIGTDTPPYLAPSAQYGPNLQSVANRVQPGTRYTFIAAWDGDVAPTRFRLALLTDFPARRSIFNRVVAGPGTQTERTVVIERDGRTYGYVMFDTGVDDNWLVSTLTNTGQEIDFAILEGDFVKGESYKALAKRVDFGEVVSTPVLEAGNIISPMFSRGKNLFDGVFMYGYNPIYSEITNSNDYNVHLTPTYSQTDPAYKTLVSVVVPCKPNTKYAISRSGGTRFYIGLSKYLPSTYIDSGNYLGLMRTALNNNAIDSYVITTNENDRFIYIYLSNSGGVNWCQVEENDHVTSYETYGWRFTHAAESIRNTDSSGGRGVITAGVGDGITDDSDSLQAAINAITGGIDFDSQKKYFLGKSLLVNAANAKYINGNRATFIVGGDFPAFTVDGGMGDGDSSPGSTGSTARSFGGFRIDSLRVYSVDGVSGTGLALSGMLHPRITNCDLMYLKTGIKFSKRSRNVIISDNHIYACSNYGIHYDNTCNIHQMNLIGNVITYCKRNIFLDNASIYNMQITGNDIETGEYLVGDSALRANIWITAMTSYVEDIVIVGNTLEDHWTADNLVKMEGASSANILSVSISGNSAGNSKKHNIELGGCSGIDISGQFKNSMGYTLSFAGDVTGLTLSAQEMKNQNSGGLLTSNGAYNLTDISVTGCQVSGAGAKNMIRLSGKPNLTNFIIHGNNLHDRSSETPVIIDAGAVKGVRVDFNHIANSSNTSGEAMSIGAKSVSGKNSMLFNSADNGAFTAPDTFSTQGNI